jgi:sortase A
MRSSVSVSRRQLRRLELILFSAAGLALSVWWACITGGRIVQFWAEHSLSRATATAQRGDAPGTPRLASGNSAVTTEGTTCIGRIEIPRIRLSTMILEGTGSLSLLGGAGHLVGSALPGETGNVVLAAHRDTFFRPLGGVRRGDQIRIVTPDRTFVYRIDSITIVNPSQVEVLDQNGEARLTLVTCYPFNWLGRAPKRFIVAARQIAVSNSTTGLDGTEQSAATSATG